MTYEKGFEEKCAEYGITKEYLEKEANVLLDALFGGAVGGLGGAASGGLLGGIVGAATKDKDEGLVGSALGGAGRGAAVGGVTLGTLYAILAALAGSQARKAARDPMGSAESMAGLFGNLDKDASAKDEDMEKEAFVGALGRLLRRGYASAAKNVGRWAGGAADDAAEGWAKKLYRHGTDLGQSLAPGARLSREELAMAMQNPRTISSMNAASGAAPAGPTSVPLYGLPRDVASVPRNNKASTNMLQDIAGGGGGAPINWADYVAGGVPLGLGGLGVMASVPGSNNRQMAQQQAQQMGGGMTGMTDEQLAAFVAQNYPQLMR